jgi:hypothetical protein
MCTKIWIGAVTLSFLFCRAMTNRGRDGLVLMAHLGHLIFWSLPIPHVKGSMDQHRMHVFFVFFFDVYSWDAGAFSRIQKKKFGLLKLVLFTSKKKKKKKNERVLPCFNMG